MTITASGVLAAVVAYRLNATKEHVFFMRQKAEALYLSIERYDRALGSHFVTYYGVFKNEISYDQLFDLKISSSGGASNNSAGALDTATMLINVYFSNLRLQLDGYTSSRENINQIIAAHKRAYKSGDTDGGRWFKQFDEAMKELVRTAKAFKQAILFEAVKLAPADQLWPRSLTLSALWSRVKRFVPKMKRYP